MAALPFTLELARLSALEFMGLACQHLRLRELWVGPDFALGYRREGTVTRLTEIGQELGYQVHVVLPLVLVSGTVVPGDQRDCQLGFPAAELVVDDGVVLPAGGIYAAYARRGVRQWPAMAYAGLSFAGSERRLEVHIPDLADDLNGQSLRVEFVRCLRCDVRFTSAEDLTSQLDINKPADFSKCSLDFR